MEYQTSGLLRLSMRKESEGYIDKCFIIGVALNVNERGTAVALPSGRNHLLFSEIEDMLSRWREVISDKYKYSLISSERTPYHLLFRFNKDSREEWQAATQDMIDLIKGDNPHQIPGSVEAGAEILDKDNEPDYYPDPDEKMVIINPYFPEVEDEG